VNEKGVVVEVKKERKTTAEALKHERGEKKRGDRHQGV
jgi:hypothetical protein